MNSTIVIILITIALLVIALIAFLIIRRQRYVRALRGRGWTFESRPALESVLDHHAPPFGLGFVRKVDEAISGTTAAGIKFRVFEYMSSEGGPKFDDRVASMQLPLPLPDLFVSTGGVRSGVQAASIDVDPTGGIGVAVVDELAGVAVRVCLDEHIPGCGVGRGPYQIQSVRIDSQAELVAGCVIRPVRPDRVWVDGANLVSS